MTLFLGPSPTLFYIDDNMPAQSGQVFVLREHQEEALQNLKKMRSEHQTIALVQGATGSGKSAIGVLDAKEVGKRTLFLAHSKELVEQGYSNFRKLANAEVEIAYDPMNTDVVKVMYRDMEPVYAARVRMGSFCDKTPDVPAGMTNQVPETSRFLDALERKYREDHKLMADALSFGDYGKTGDRNV